MKIFIQFVFGLITTTAYPSLSEEIDVEALAKAVVESEVESKLKESMENGVTTYVCAVRNMETINLFPDIAAVTKQVTIEEIKKEDNFFDEGPAIFGDSYLFPVEQAFVLDLADIATKSLQGSNMTYWIDGESLSFTATELRNHGSYYDGFKEQSVFSSADIYNLNFDSLLKRGEVMRIRKQHQRRNPRVAEITRLYFECTDYR